MSLIFHIYTLYPFMSIVQLGICVHHVYKYACVCTPLHFQVWWLPLFEILNLWGWEVWW